METFFLLLFLTLIPAPAIARIKANFSPFAFVSLLQRFDQLSAFSLCFDASKGQFCLIYEVLTFANFVANVFSLN